jgi:hypothetical protein
MKKMAQNTHRGPFGQKYGETGAGRSRAKGTFVPRGGGYRRYRHGVRQAKLRRQSSRNE